MSRVRQNEDGTGLVELITVVAILSIVLGVILSGFASMQTASAGNNERILDVNEARLIMQTTTKDLRTAVPPSFAVGSAALILAKPAEIEFYSSLNTIGTPVKVHLFVDAQTRLVETITDPVAGSPPTYPGPAKQRMVAEYVANKATDPIFTYYKADGTALNATNGLTAAEALSVTSIGLNFIVRHDTKLPVKPTTLVNRVRLPNTGYTP